MRGSYEENRAALMSAYRTWAPQSVWDLFECAVREHGHREFVRFSNGRGFTYSQAHEQVLKLSDSLCAMGVCAGMPVAIQATNCPESVLLSLALSKIGATKVSLNAASGAIELVYALRQTGARVLFCEDVARVDVSLLEGEHLPRLRMLVVPRAAHVSVPSDLCECAVLPWHEVAHGGLVVPEKIAWDAHEAVPGCDVMFTSGTSGFPKAVVLTDEMLIRNAFANCLNRGFEDGRRVYVPIPLFHVYGYVEGFLSVMFVGGSLLMNAGKLPAAKALAFMRQAQANDALAVPSIMSSYLRELATSPADFPDLHALYCSASECAEGIWEAIRDAFGVNDLITGYGMTEVGGASMQTSPFDEPSVLPRRVGRLIGLEDIAGKGADGLWRGANFAYRVCDPQTGRVCERGEFGELVCRGPSVTRGYLSEQGMDTSCFDEEGWFHTGDIGRFDRAGYLELRGRTLESYKINGENVSVALVEDVMGRCRGVETAKVVGVPHERFGAVGAAFVQLDPDTRKDRARFETYCEKTLARFQVPQYYWYVAEEDWPRTPTGKIRCGVLKQRAEELRRCADALALEGA